MKNIYADKGRIPREFKIGERVVFKVKPKKGYLKLRSCINIAIKYCQFSHANQCD
jgi:hypothetical protein